MKLLGGRLLVEDLPGAEKRLGKGRLVEYRVVEVSPYYAGGAALAKYNYAVKGDVILTKSNAGTPLTFDDRAMMLLETDDVIAIVSPEDNENDDLKTAIERK